jgi:predicted RNA-binding protein YlqC (UPF0109 family)
VEGLLLLAIHPPVVLIPRPAWQRIADGRGSGLIPFAHRSKLDILLLGSGFRIEEMGRGKYMTQNQMVAVDALVREIARALVDEPDAVDVQIVGREENTVLKLRVAPNDVGKVIGKQGRTARSMRTILGAVSMKLHHRYTLDILEEDDPA